MMSGMFWMTPAQLLDRFEYHAGQTSDPQFSKGIPIIQRWAMLCSTEKVSQAQFDELIRQFEAGGVPSRVEIREWRILPVGSSTTNRPSGKTAAGGMRHGEAYQEVGGAA